MIFLYKFGYLPILGNVLKILENHISLLDF